MVSMSSAKPEPKSLPRKFYTLAAFEPVDSGFSIILDGKRVRTPAQQLLQVKSEVLAAAIAAEWNAQDAVIDTDAMPLTRLAHIALDRVALDRKELLEDICRYGETDLVCYRAPIQEQDNPLAEDNKPLRVRQDVAFDPVLAWAASAHGITLAVTDGILPVPQEASSLAKLAAVFAAATDHELAALAMMVPMLGSAMLTLAVWKGFLSIDDALVAARLDEDDQALRWGMDVEAMKAWAPKERDLRASAFFLTGKPL